MNSPEIHVHVPKSAGITIRGLLIEKYGPENVYSNDVVSGRLASMAKQGFKADNSQRGGRNKLAKIVTPTMAQVGLAIRDRLIGEEPSVVIKKASAVIGHFAVDTFDTIPEASQADYFTVLRNPLDRMVSHYRYLKQLDHKMAKMRHWGAGHNPHRPFTEFALDERLQNYATKFTGTDLGRYALVGTFERLDDFCNAIGLSIPGQLAPNLNEGKWHGQVNGIDDPGFVRDFEKFHSLDYETYHQVA